MDTADQGIERGKAEHPRQRSRRRASVSGAQTRQALIDAARPLFVRDGFKAASIRAIADEAGVNSALIGYHFGSKEELFVAVYKAAAEPVNTERLRLFAKLEARGRFTASDVVEAWVRPMIVGRQAESGFAVADLALVINVGDPERYDRLASETFEEVNEKFLALMQECIPHVPRSTLVWRLHFLIGAILTVARQRRVAILRLSRGECDPGDREKMLAELVNFAAAGFESPD